jgi:hypothetical protein
MNPLTFTLKYGVLDYSIPENSLLSSYSDDDRWFIYGPIRQSTTSSYWIDNWNSLWERICISEYPALGLTMRQSVNGFDKPMSNQYIENIISQKWILDSTNPFSIHRGITHYVEMFQEIETLKGEIIYIKQNYRSELEAAGQLLDSLTIHLDKEKNKKIIVPEHDLLLFDT